MKTLASLFMFCILCLNIMAQAPQKMSYQAVVRNASGNLVTNHAVGMRISILQGSATGIVVFSETCVPVPQTNTNGLVTIEVGSGSPLTGTFSGINWANGPFFLKVETDPSGGTNYTISGSSQLLSVPYALYAKDVQNNNDADADVTNELQKISLSGTVLTLDKSGGSVTLPSSGEGDNWGNQVVVADASLGGNGTTATPLKVADNGITSSKILDGTIGSSDIAGDAINNTKIQDGSIVTADLADQTVSTAKLGNLAVSADKIQNGAVVSDKLANGSVSTDKLGTGAVTGIKIADNAVTVAKLPTGAASDKYLRGDGTWAIPSGGSTAETDPTWSGAANETSDIGRTGRVGIGTVTPGTILHVFSNSTMDLPQLLLDENDADYARLMFRNNAPSTKNWTIAGAANPSDAESKMNFYFWNGSSGSDMLTITGEGKVGIGESSPAATLDIAGQIKISDGYEALGKVLTSDAAGLASWKSPVGFTLPYSGTTSTGGNAFSITNALSTAIYGEVTGTTGITYGLKGKVYSSDGFSGHFTGGKFYINGNTGIGTENPSALLHAQGTGTGGGNVVFEGEWKENPGNPPVSGTGTRMMWYPDKGAFRVGYTEGDRWDAANIGATSVAMGRGTKASGAASTALGYYAIASGEVSIAMGSVAEATGSGSVSIGSYTQATGNVSTAMGNGTVSSGTNSTAMGYMTHATGSASTALGDITYATGSCSTAMGSSTSASGRYSTAIGYGVSAPSYAETAIGSYSESYTPYNATDWDIRDRLFVIGNGYLGPNNALTMLKSGDIAIGHSQPEARIDVHYNSDMSKPHLLLYEWDNDYARLMFKNYYNSATWTIAGLPALAASDARVNFFYTATGDVLSIAGNGRVGINTTNPSQALHVVGDAYKTNGGTSWATTSDIRLKNLLGNYTKGLEEITSLQPVRFFYRADNPRKLPADIEQVGFVAQEVRKIFPEAVSQGTDGYLDFNIHSVNVAMVNAIKELKAENDRLKVKNERLEAENLKIFSRLEHIETLLGVKAEK